MPIIQNMFCVELPLFFISIINISLDMMGGIDEGKHIFNGSWRAKATFSFLSIPAFVFYISWHMIGIAMCKQKVKAVCIFISNRYKNLTKISSYLYLINICIVIFRFLWYLDIYLYIKCSNSFFHNLVIMIYNWWLS